MKRLRVAEVMDQPALDRLAHEHALRSLNRANRLFGVDRRMWNLVRKVGDERYSVLDLACGGGGFLCYAAGRTGKDRSARLVGLDRSCDAIRFAHGRSTADICWIVGDALRLPIADHGVDVVTCSLFLHHFDEPEVIMILQEACRVARRAIVVGELVRSRSAWLLTCLVTRLMSRSWIFHVDGPRSVRAAFRANELRNLAGQAGLLPVTVKRVFPFRYVMTWRRPGH